MGSRYCARHDSAIASPMKSIFWPRPWHKENEAGVVLRNVTMIITSMAEATWPRLNIGGVWFLYGYKWKGKDEDKGTRRGRCWSLVSGTDRPYVTLLINAAVSCHYFLTGPRLPSYRIKSVTALGRYHFLLLGEHACERLVSLGSVCDSGKARIGPVSSRSLVLLRHHSTRPMAILQLV